MSLDEHLDEAARILREVEPSACLVLPRVVRRVIKEHGEFGGMALNVPHRKCYLIELDRLLWYVSLDELKPFMPATERVILIAWPDEQELEGMTLPQLLRDVWRLLFHARIHAELDSEVAVGRLSPQAVHSRIDRIGQAEFDEALSVLRQENLLLAPGNLTAGYVEFAAVWNELRFFHPEWRSSYFPSIHDPAHVDAIVDEDLEAAALFRQTMLPGAAQPHEPSAAILEPLVRQMLRWADDAGSRGNAVRAALLRSAAGGLAPPGYADETSRRANEELDRLCQRLQQALRFPEDERPLWRRALGSLLANSRRGFWDADKRLLYDLQNVCVDHERELSVLDPLPWLFTLGRRPLKRPLPHMRAVLVARHLRRAQSRLPASQLEGEDREVLTGLLRHSAETAEEGMRNQYRPILSEALDAAGLQPENLPERVALKKVVEELLDVIVERGFVTIGILRDAVSRNNLKFPDFPEAPRPRITAETNGQPAAPETWLQRAARKTRSGLLALVGMPSSSDPLLRMDATLSRVLDGVYRRAEVYLRVLQGVSAMAFGTPVGRFLTKYVALPVGGSYVILMGLQHLVHLVQHNLLHVPAPAAAAATATAEAAGGHHGEAALPNLYAWVGLSMFLFGMLHIPPFRTLVLRHVLLSMYHVLKGLFFDIPRWLLRLPWVHRIVFSRGFTLVRRFVVTPLAVTGVVWAFFPVFGQPFPNVWWFVGGAALAAALLNSRIGRDVEERSAEELGRLWYNIRSRIFVALYELVMDTFKRILESAERVLYAVDEWLRFRSGESRLSLALKATLGVIWGGVTYVLRFLINLIVEPQVNPIKHFPVVTVSHKMILPTQPLLADLLIPAMGSVYGNTVALFVVTTIPGVFGFLVWELKENWRLFAANRRRHLAPVMIGHHGESLIRLMKPGLHSGTLPKLYRKMRRAHRKSYLLRSRVALTRYHESLHHLEISIRRFVERELVSLLNECPAWDAPAVSVGHLHVASNTVRVELRCPGLGDQPASLTFEEQCGWLVAHVSRVGWIGRLSPQSRALFETALLGVYKLGGVDVIREEIAATFSPHEYPYDLREQQLIVWPDPQFKSEVHYSFEERPSRARPRSVARHFHMPEIDSHHLMLSRRPVSWRHWVSAWSATLSGANPAPLLANPPAVLPPSAAGVEAGRHPPPDLLSPASQTH